MNDRRKEPRFRLRDNAFAIGPGEPKRLGKLIDISRSGLSFQYMEEANNFGAGTELHIFSSAHSLFLESFSFEIVSDSPMPKHPASTLYMRRRGGRFSLLAAGQQAQLDEFISLHSEGIARTGS